MKTTLRIAIIAFAILIIAAAATAYWMLQTPTPTPQQTANAKAQSVNAAPLADAEIPIPKPETRSPEPDASNSEPEPTPTPKPTPRPEPTHVPAPPPKTCRALDPSLVPPEFAGFLDWDSRKQAQAVTERMKNPDLDPATLSFFKAAIHDPELGLLVRNNMANALLNQERKDTQLYREFIDMCRDPEQSERWRAYCIQFLAGTRPYTDDKGAVDRTLFGLARGDDPLASQAQMMLATLEQRGQLRLDGEFATLQAAVLSNETATTGDRIAALSLLGQRKAAECRDIIRQYATKPCPERRVAIAALGQIADPEDKAIIQAVLDDPEAGFLVKKAAETAIKNFK
ncbi:HEAT repeat domain-containing protein [Candidatus Sumerlaeota bacterium]|nr:HEAT repeat domain-containing protein [Candidatus Sumerlaeota bacterium]